MVQNMNDWRIWWQIVMRRRYYFLLTLLVAIVLGLVWAFSVPPVFESSSMIMFIDTDLLSGSSLRFVPTFPQREEMELFRRRITGSEFLERILDSLDLKNDPKLAAQIEMLMAEHPQVPAKEISDQVLLKFLREQISTQMRAYNLLELKTKGRSPEQAFRLASLITDQAIREALDNQIQSVSAASSFSSQQMQIYKQRLEEAEERLSHFNRQQVEMSNGEVRLSEGKLQELQSVKLSMEVEFQTKNAQLQELRATVFGTATPPYRAKLDGAIANLSDRMVQLTMDVCQLLKKFNWRDLEIVQLNTEIGQLKAELNDRIVATLKNYYTDAESEQMIRAARYENLAIEARLLKKSRDILTAVIQEHLEYVRRQPANETMKTRLEREVRLYREIYDLLLQQVRGTQIRESAQIQESRMKYKLITSPQHPLERVKPNRRRIMMVSVFLGMMLGAGLIFGLETLDTSIRNVEDVTRFLKTPLLATIPRIITPKQDKDHKKYRHIFAVLIPVFLFACCVIVLRILF